MHLDVDQQMGERLTPWQFDWQPPHSRNEPEMGVTVEINSEEVQRV